MEINVGAHAVRIVNSTGKYAMLSHKAKIPKKKNDHTAGEHSPALLDILLLSNMVNISFVALLCFIHTNWCFTNLANLVLVVGRSVFWGAWKKSY